MNRKEAIPINFIKKLRVNREMTQAQLAKACGVTQGTVAMWEKGMTFPKTEKISIVAEVLGCDSRLLLKMAEERQKRRIGA